MNEHQKECIGTESGVWTRASTEVRFATRQAFSSRKSGPEAQREREYFRKGIGEQTVSRQSVKTVFEHRKHSEALAWTCVHVNQIEDQELLNNLNNYGSRKSQERRISTEAA